MSLVEIEKYIQPLSYAEKIQLIQDIAEMLKEAADDALLHRLDNAAKAIGPQGSGPLEAYDAAAQLHQLAKKEAV